MKKFVIAILGSFVLPTLLTAVPSSAAACADCGCQNKDKGGEKDCGCKSDGKKCTCEKCNCKGKDGACDCGKKDGSCSCDKVAKDDAKDGTPKAFSQKPSIGTKAKCPVMGGEFTVAKDTQFSEYKGKFYAFCCPGCKPQFDKEPEKFIK